MIPVNTDERLTSLVQGSLERNDDELERVAGVLTNVVADLGDVLRVERGVDLVEQEEGRGTNLEDRDEERERFRFYCKRYDIPEED